MKKFVFILACMVLFGSLASAETAITEIGAGSFLGFPGEAGPVIFAGTPPPGDALDVLVAEGLMTSAERDLFWEAYNNGIDEGQKSIVFNVLMRICDTVSKSAWMRTAILYAVDKTVTWYNDNYAGSGGGSGPNVASPGSYRQPLEQ